MNLPSTGIFLLIPLYYVKSTNMLLILHNQEQSNLYSTLSKAVKFLQITYLTIASETKSLSNSHYIASIHINLNPQKSAEFNVPHSFSSLLIIC